MMRWLLLVVAVGCSSGTQASADLAGSDLAMPSDLSRAIDLAGVDFAGLDLAGTAKADLATVGSACSNAAMCRLYSNNCDGCVCQALRTDEIDPVCAGTPFNCFVDPCDGKSADCVGGHCVVK